MPRWAAISRQRSGHRSEPRCFEPFHRRKAGQQLGEGDAGDHQCARREECDHGRGPARDRRVRRQLAQLAAAALEHLEIRYLDATAFKSQSSVGFQRL